MCVNYYLDFGIYYSKDRCESIKNLPLDKLSRKELEQIADFILYGKDEDGTSSVDRKEVEIKTKFNTWSKKKPESLEALMETPGFNEATLKPLTPYKKPKPQITEKDLKNVKGLAELQETIKKFSDYLKEYGDSLTRRQKYLLNHQLISLRQQQYLLLGDRWTSTPNRLQYFDWEAATHVGFPVYPRGVMRTEDDTPFKFPRTDSTREAKAMPDPKKLYFSFLEPFHIYELILAYYDLKAFVAEMPDSLIHNLLWTLDFYISAAKLTPEQLLIVEEKKKGKSIKEIATTVEKQMGIHHQENYISTIWGRITNKIAATANLNYDEFLCKDYDKAWKICSSCGRELLRDPRQFSRKSKLPDGLNSRCKKCEREARRYEKELGKIVSNNEE